MRIFDGTDGVTEAQFRTPVVSLGVFDGLHRGHRAVIARTRELAARVGGDVVLLTFHVHPRAVTEGAAPPLITSLPHKLALLAREGVDTTIVLHFDEAMRAMTAERFVLDLLVEKLGVRGVVVGHDSHFGNERQGDGALLERMLVPRGIPVEQMPPVLMPDGTLVSSTAIRAAVASGDLSRAAELLGRPPALYGTVVRGDGRGRTLGFPTANLDLGGELRPSRGVYGAFVVIDGKHWAAVVNIGGRPTFYPEGEGEDTAEIHILDWQGDLYGQTLEAFILGKIRDERRFGSVDLLRAQIADDIEASRRRVASGEWRL